MVVNFLFHFTVAFNFTTNPIYIYGQTLKNLDLS